MRVLAANWQRWTKDLEPVETNVQLSPKRSTQRHHAILSLRC
jgi:hypothetical protein